jgi:hypothetical protein
LTQRPVAFDEANTVSQLVPQAPQFSLSAAVLVSQPFA